MSTVHPPPRHRAAGPQGFGRDPHPSGPIPVPAPRKPPPGDAVVRFTPLAARVPAPRFPATAPLPAAPVRCRRLPLGVACVLAVVLAAGVAVVLVTLRTVPPSLPTPLPVAAPAAMAPAPATTFGDGTVAVGVAIVPGTYRAPGGPHCRWSRLTPSGSVRASGTAGRVTIRPTDGAVRSAGCGAWQRTAP